MNKNIFSLMTALLVFSFFSSPSHGGVVKEPPLGSTATTGVTPNVLIILDSSGSMLCPAYWKNSDGTDKSCSGPPGTSYISKQFDPTVTYYGYFDPTKKYSWASNTWTIDTAGLLWDGNFLNWVTMRRIDIAKKVLVGGDGYPKARQALAAPNSIKAHESTNSQFGNYEYIKMYDRALGEANGYFPAICGTDSYCYFGVKDGYLYVDDDTNVFSQQIARLSLDINITTEWTAGVIQEVSGQVRLGLEYFNDDQGGFIDQPMADPPVAINFINAIENLDPDTYTPLAESLYTAAGYYGISGVTGDDGPRYFSASAKSYFTSGSNSDPFDFAVQNDVYCADSFVILVTDGAPTKDENIPSTPFTGSGILTDYDGDGDDPGSYATNGSDYLDDVALWAHTTDLRSMQGTQSITLFTIFAFGSGSDILKNAAINGGFIDSNGNNLPDPSHPSDWSTYTAPFSSNEWDKNADGNPDNYYEAQTGTDLELALRAAFTQILALTNTVTSPVIMPGAPGEGFNLYTSTFVPDMEHQWEGHLYKYPLDSNGFLQGTAPNYLFTWDAGDILGDTCAGTCVSSTQRDIFTVSSSLSGINNITEGNWSDLMPLLGTNDATTRTLLGYDAVSDPTFELSTGKLIRFIRGIDAFDEDVDGDATEDRWKLADIFNSRPIVVSGPAYSYQDATDNNYITGFKTPNSSRDIAVYAGGNDGMVHAFLGTTGVELWGFIPPNILGNLKEMISPVSNRSSSQYFTDSSPIVEDVYINGSWKTVLVSGLRWGGRGYFALDVTDPNNPIFLWAVSTDGNTVTRWDSNGSSTDMTGDADFNGYLKLGYSWSEPVTGRVRLDAASDKWVFVVGGGYRALQPDVDFDLPDHAAGVGRQMFVFNIADGSIVHRFTESTITAVGSNGIDNSIPATLSATVDSDNYLQFLYGGDREAQIWKTNISGSSLSGNTTETTGWDSCRIFDGKATYSSATNPANTANNRRFIYAQPELSEDTNGNRWIFFGTGDGRNPSDPLPKVSSPATEDEGNIFVALMDDDPNPALGSSCGNTYTTANMTDVTATSATLTAPAQGWYIHLAEGEKSFTPPLVYAGAVLFTTFIPDTTDICSIGTSYLYLLNFTNGGILGAGSTMGSVSMTTKSISLGSGKVTAPVVSGDKIQMGVTGNPTQADLQNIANLGGKWTGNIITLPLPTSLSVNPVKIISWKEIR